MRSLIFLLPRRLISDWVGRLAQIQWSYAWRPVLWEIFCSIFGVNRDEIEKPLAEYPSWDAFFTRKLKEGVRPLSSASYVHPADAVLTESSGIRGGSLVQAKGILYSVSDFLGSGSVETMLEGGQALTYYLSPKDYHRVHSPVSGEIVRICYRPGDLFPVNSWAVHHVPRLFSINERMIVEIRTPHGIVFLVMVGALNVGKISLSFLDEQIRSRQVEVRNFFPTLSINKGQELGCFHLGSTVVILADASAAQALQLGRLKAGVVRMGSSENVSH